MTFRRRRTCAAYGCGNAVSKGYCDNHKPAQEAKNKQRLKKRWSSSEKNIYNNRNWRSIRANQLALEPLCNKCLGPANVVDHIIPVNSGGAFDEPSNLQSLCAPCHNRKTGNERVSRQGGIIWGYDWNMYPREITWY